MSEDDKREWATNTEEYWQKYVDSLVHKFVVAVMALIIILVAAVALASYQLRVLNNRINVASTSQKIIKQEITPSQVEEIKLALAPTNGHDGANGSDGVSGVSGTNGTNGSNGQNGQNVTPEMVASAVLTIIQQDPDKFKGDQGDSGADGTTLVAFIRQNPITALWECRYSNSILWQPVAECGQ